MKHPVIVSLKFLLRGITWGCTYFVFFCLFAYCLQGKDFLRSILEGFPRHALGSMLVGIGYGTTPIVYLWERPSLFAKVSLHFFVGTGTFFCVAFWLAWIPMQSGQTLALEFAVSCITFALSWSVFYLFSRKEARAINDRLKELSKKQ